MSPSVVRPLNTIQMKNTFTWAACAAALALASCGAPAESNSDTAPAKEEAKTAEAASFIGGTYTIDPAASTVNWKGTKITTDSHVGTINVHKGTINVIDNTIAKAFVAIDMNSIVCTDEGMDDDTKANLVGHLSSDDFFGVEQFPYARLDVEGIKVKDGEALAYGQIVIREIAQPINFPITIGDDNGNIVVDAFVTFDRSKHDVKFRSGAFPELFPNLGDKLINDDIELDVHIVATL